MTRRGAVARSPRTPDFHRLDSDAFRPTISLFARRFPPLPVSFLEGVNMTTRRDFLTRSSALAGAALVAGTHAPLRALGLDNAERGPLAAGGLGAGHRPSDAPAPRQLRILLLGGTGFIGPHLVNRIVTRGHTLTLFNRGRSEPGLYQEKFIGLENLIGDRQGDISALEGRTWDVVIDNSGYTPVEVGATARLLKGQVGQYIFTSTRGVYAGFLQDPMDESAPVGIRGVPDTEWTGYGPLKALAERDIHENFPEGTTIVRPPIITGPGDNTDRFTYWYLRVDQGGEVLAPGDPSDPIQYVDVRDVADFVVHLSEQGTRGTFNITSPAAPLSTGEFLHGLRATTGNPVRFTWVDWDFLEAQRIRGGQEIAAWRSPRGDNLNYGRVDNSRAIAAGMTFRPLASTAIDTVAWWRSLNGPDARPRSGIAVDREAVVLALWHESRGR